MTAKSLEQKLQSHESPFEMLYHSPAGVFQFPLQPEFSNWRDEQEAWRKTAVFQDMSFHMTNVHVEGRGVLDLVSHLAVNSFESFGEMRAKHFVACNYDGYVLGDGILICEEDNRINLLGRAGAVGWLAFHAATGDFDVKISRIERPSPRLADRYYYRYQIQGPSAIEILEQTNGASLPEIGFFKMGKFRVGPHSVTALNHRMTGAPGYEIWGPAEEGEAVKKLILQAGEKHNLTQVGGAVYPVTAIESGWLGGTVPAIYTGDAMKSYREWLPEQSPEASGSLGGSFFTEDIEDLYVTPYDLGYGFMVKFDHDFIGREPLERISQEPHRKKVRLCWSQEDVLDVMASAFSKGDRYKFMQAPSANYSFFSFDEVLLDGRRVGMSNYPVYSSNERGWISLAIIDEELAQDGRELIVTWGEPNGGSRKPTVERHIQKAIRVSVDTRPVKRD